MKSGQNVKWLGLQPSIGKTQSFEICSSKSGFQLFPDFEWSDFRSPLVAVTKEGKTATKHDTMEQGTFIHKKCKNNRNSEEGNQSLLHKTSYLNTLSKNYFHL